jgi:hypothetical protein
MVCKTAFYSSYSLSQCDWDSSQLYWDNLPSQNRASVTSRWDTVSVTLSPGMRAQTVFT